MTIFKRWRLARLAKQIEGLVKRKVVGATFQKNVGEGKVLFTIDACHGKFIYMKFNLKELTMWIGGKPNSTMDFADIASSKMHGDLVNYFIKRNILSAIS